MSNPLAASEEDAAVLERVARQYGADSPEGMALRRAGLALLFAALDHHEQFEEFFRQADTDAAAEAAAYLAALRAKVEKRRTEK